MYTTLSRELDVEISSRKEKKKKKKTSEKCSVHSCTGYR